MVFVFILPVGAIYNNFGVAISLNLLSVKNLYNMFTTYQMLIEYTYTNEIIADIEGKCLSANSLPSIKSLCLLFQMRFQYLLFQ